MNKIGKIVIAVVAIIAVVVLAVALIVYMSKPKSNLDPIESSEDLAILVDKVYEGVDVEMPMVMTQIIDVGDIDMVNYVTGLQDTKDVEYVVASEPMMTSQAYSFVLVKVKDGVNVQEVAKEMNENINARKWVCVTAEKVYTTTSGDVICLVMSNRQTARAVYESFKTLAGGIGEEYERTEEEPELPEDMLSTDDDGALSGDDTLPAYDGETLTGEDPETNTTDSVE